MIVDGALENPTLSNLADGAKVGVVQYMGRWVVKLLCTACPIAAVNLDGSV